MDATGICNLALGYVGRGPISALGVDTSTAGALCNTFYYNAKHKLLAARNWTFAKEYWQVTPEAGDPPHPKWAASYAVPADCLRVHRVDDGTGSYDVEWEKVGGLICTERAVDTLYVEGVIGETGQTLDEAKFTPAFSFALAAELATHICLPLTKDVTLWSGMLKLAEKNLLEAAGVEGSQGRSERVTSDSLTRRR